MTDVSDGLIRDLKHITLESNVGAMVELEKIPLSKETKNYLKNTRPPLKPYFPAEKTTNCFLPPNPEQRSPYAAYRKGSA